MPNIGDAIYGGYFAGYMDTTKGNIIAADASQTGARYMLIVSPLSLEQASLQYKTATTGAPASSSTRWNGLAATAAMTGATYPAANYCNGLSYPGDGGSQWYLPAMDEWELLYRNLKPDTYSNYVVGRPAGTFPGVSSATGVNASSDPAGAAYTTGAPAQTSPALFQSGGAQALNVTGAYYWCSTEYSATDAWAQITSGGYAGYQGNSTKNGNNRVRPVRRVLVDALPSPVTNNLATAYSNQKKLVTLSTGRMVSVVAYSTTAAEFMWSDDGKVWSNYGVDIAGWANGSIAAYVDSGGVERLVVTWKQSGTGGSRTDQYTYAMVGTFNSGRTTITWGTAQVLAGTATIDYLDLAVTAVGTGGAGQVLASYSAGNQTLNGNLVIDSAGVLAGTSLSTWTGYGGSSHTYPSIDINPITKDMYGAWSAGATGTGKGIRFKKATYSAGTWTWGSEVEVDTTRGTVGNGYNHICRWDGTRAVIGGTETDNTNVDLVVYETTNFTSFTTRVLYDGISIYWAGMAIDTSTGDIYFFGMLGSHFSLRYYKWTRATTTLGSPVIVDGAYIDNDPNAICSGNKIRWIYTAGNNSPYQVKYDELSLVPPNVAGDVTAVPAIARALAPTGIVIGVGASIDAVPAIARALVTAPDVLSADIVNAVAGAARALAPISQPSAAYTIDAVPAVATAYQGGPIDIFWNGLFARVGIAHTGATAPTVTVLAGPITPVYTVDQYRARFLDPQVNVTRRVEILEADGSTLWDDRFGNKKRLISGAVSVDYTRDERRSCDLELANFDGALVHKPDGFWYDKVLRLFRGIEFYDESGLRSYEVTLGTFMIDRVTQARFPKIVKITARDFTKKCMLSKFGQATGFTAGTAIETVIAAMASNSGIFDMVLPVTGKTLGVDTFFERDMSRWDAMKQIAEAFGYELFFNAQNFLVMRLFIDPTLGAISHEFKTGPSTGNLVNWEKSTNDTRIFNHVSITGADANSLPVWAEALNNNPSSPTNIARMGDRTYSQESAFVTTTQQAQDLADSYLKINGLEEYDVNLTSIPAPWLEAGEIVRFTDPDAPSSDPDRFLMTSLTIPLDLSPMSAVGRRVTIVS